MIMKFPHMCDLCGLPMSQEEHKNGVRCDKCRKNPLRTIINTYGNEDDKMRIELYESDHDCRRPDACSFCGKVYKASHEELLKLLSERGEHAV